jgi:hypothetical protein
MSIRPRYLQHHGHYQRNNGDPQTWDDDGETDAQHRTREAEERAVYLEDRQDERRDGREHHVR